METGWISPQMILTVFLVFIIIGVGVYVLNDVDTDQKIGVGFCINKTGVYDGSVLEGIIEDVYTINCSNRKRPISYNASAVM